MVKRTQELSSSVVISKPELMGMKPIARSRRVQELILMLLSDKKPRTTREIVEQTGLSRITVSKHLQGLVSGQQVSAQERNLGDLSVIYYNSIGQSNTKETESRFSANVNYVFFTLESEEEPSICIQQREKDEYGIEKVKGAIAINFDNFEKFLRELHAYGAKVIQN